MCTGTEHRWWEGTSSVWRAPDYNETGRYLINYSEYPNGGNQTITFAESFDLIHWQRPPPLNATYFPIDTAQGYKAPGRWDTIYSVPVPGAGQENARDGYPRYGFWTASPQACGHAHDCPFYMCVCGLPRLPPSRRGCPACPRCELGVRTAAAQLPLVSAASSDAGWNS